MSLDKSLYESTYTLHGTKLFVGGHRSTVCLQVTARRDGEIILKVDRHLANSTDEWHLLTCSDARPLYGRISCCERRDGRRPVLNGDDYFCAALTSLICHSVGPTSRRALYSHQPAGALRSRSVDPAPARARVRARAPSPSFGRLISRIT